MGAHLGWYIPIEISVLLTGAAYFLGSEVAVRRTVGKWFCGLTIRSKHGGVPERHRLGLRAFAGKVLFLLPFGVRFAFGELSRGVGLGLAIVLLVLGASFVWCAFDRQKRAGHDWLAGTLVLRRQPPGGRWSVLAAAVVLVWVGLWFVGISDRISIARDYRLLQPEKPLPPLFEKRDAGILVEAGSWDPAGQTNAAAWLKTHALSPVEYAVAKARRYQVLVMGESHGTKDHLEFLKALVPRLREQAGVTTIALEACLAMDNTELERLVTGKTYDRELALRLARRDPSGIWGYQEYWDVLETVWQVNQSLASPEKKLRIIGLESVSDQRSDALLGTDAEGQSIIPKYCPWWESLRRFRLLRSNLRIEARDVQMAARIEREVFGRGERAIVWVGQAHACASPNVLYHGQRNRTMGAMLRQKHPEDVGFLWLHAKDIPLSGVMESLVSMSGLPAAGFDTGTGPLAPLRDSKTFAFQFEPRLAVTDLIDGYVFLKPLAQLQPCTWMPNYVSPEMFAADKPFYRLFGSQQGRPCHSAAEVNAHLQKRRANE